MSRRGRSRKRARFHNKIKEKEIKIREARGGDKMEISAEEIESVMKKYDILDYRVDTWDNIIVRTGLDNWKISLDDKMEVVQLHHENTRLARVGNHRSRYHLHNVFYDLDFCVKTIAEHDNYRRLKH